MIPCPPPPFDQPNRAPPPPPGHPAKMLLACLNGKSLNEESGILRPKERHEFHEFALIGEMRVTIVRPSCSRRREEFLIKPGE